VAADPTKANRIVLSFDYLNPGDGAVFELLHTDKKPYPVVVGTIRGVPNGVRDWGRIVPSNRREYSSSPSALKDVELVAEGEDLRLDGCSRLKG
jgi:hypothetical protein